MIPVAAVAGVVLGVVFVAAGVAKIAQRDRWPLQAAGLGVPRRLAVVVPPVEVVLGAALIAQIARPVVALVAAGVLVAFTGLILIRLSEGKRPPCACFGGWSTTPLRVGHLVRNLALIVFAAVAAWG